MQSLPARRPALLGVSTRSPIGAAHGALSGWHPVELLAHVLDTTLAACTAAGVALGEIDRIVLANATPVGALSTPLRSLALAQHWSGGIDGIEVNAARASGHQALKHATELVASGVADNVLICAVDMASVVPPGAPLLRRDYGKPLTPSTVRELNAAGGHLPDGSLADTLGFTRDQCDARVSALFAAAAAWPATAAPTTSIINDPERTTPYRGPEFSTDEPSRRSVDALADLKAIFDPDGSITALSLAQSGDGAVAMLVSATTGNFAVGTTMRYSGSPLDPVTPLVEVARTTIDGDNVHRIVVSEPTSAHALALADRLNIDPQLLNMHGGAVARGRLGGGETLQGLHDNMSSDSILPITLLTETGDGAAFATRISPAQS